MPPIPFYDVGIVEHNRSCFSFPPFGPFSLLSKTYPCKGVGWALAVALGFIVHHVVSLLRLVSALASVCSFSMVKMRYKMHRIQHVFSRDCNSFARNHAFLSHTGSTSSTTLPGRSPYPPLHRSHDAHAH